jgi:predicted membrane channel-forming protein YqfA (hemolysin III family)
MQQHKCIILYVPLKTVNTKLVLLATCLNKAYQMRHCWARLSYEAVLLACVISCIAHVRNHSEVGLTNFWNRSVHKKIPLIIHVSRHPIQVTVLGGDNFSRNSLQVTLHVNLFLAIYVERKILRVISPCLFSLKFPSHITSENSANV